VRIDHSQSPYEYWFGEKKKKKKLKKKKKKKKKKTYSNVLIHNTHDLRLKKVVNQQRKN